MISMDIRAFIIIVTVCYGFPPELEKKYCDPSLSDQKISDLAKCEASAPIELKDTIQTCLKDIDNRGDKNKPFNYKDLIKTYCDKNARKKLQDCNNQKTDELTKSGNITDVFKNTEVMVNIESCMKKVLEVP